MQMEQLLLDEQYEELLIAAEQDPEQLRSIVKNSYVDHVQHLLEYKFERYFVLLHEILGDVTILSWDTTLERSLSLLEKLHNVGVKINNQTLLRLTQSLWIKHLDHDEAAYLHCVIADYRCEHLVDRYRYGWTYPLDESKLENIVGWEEIQQMLKKLGYVVDTQIIVDIGEDFQEHVPANRY